MGRKPSDGGLNRRRFFSTAMAGGAATATAVAAPRGAKAQAAQAGAQIGPPSAAAQAAETAPPPHEAPLAHGERVGSDYMVDVLKHLNLRYITTMPGSSFRGLHESLINYGKNTAPEILTTLHEEIAVAMAHGYYKVANEQLAVMIHGTVGLQHASMAIYNAWCDRVPMVIIAGNTLDAAKRRPGVEWAHSAQDNAIIVRDFTKWDDQPVSLAHFGESTIRGHAMAQAQPAGPVVIVTDSELQEHPGDHTALPRIQSPRPQVGDGASLAEAARMLVAAENPVIMVDRLARTQAGMDNLVTLAELLQAPVVNRYSRLNFPTQHYLNHTDRGRGLLGNADVVLGLEIVDFYGAVNDLRDVPERTSTPIIPDETKLISVGLRDSAPRSNYQDFQRFQPTDLPITGDGEATLPYLIEAVRAALTPDRRRAFEARGAQLRTQSDQLKARLRADAAVGWNASPISVPRMCAEIWSQIKGEDWALAGEANFVGFWPQKLWNMTKVYQYSGGSGGAGVGYSTPSAVGQALAHRDHGRLVVGIVGDGDFMCCPGSIWTAAHHKIPLLMVMHNNRAYHQEVMHLQRMSNRRLRGIQNTKIGTIIDEPAIDFAQMARSMGVWGAGPITDPDALAPALKQALDVVRAGEPALIDIVCQPR